MSLSFSYGMLALDKDYFSITLFYGLSRLCFYGPSIIYGDAYVDMAPNWEEIFGYGCISIAFMSLSFIFFVVDSIPRASKTWFCWLYLRFVWSEAAADWLSKHLMNSWKPTYWLPLMERSGRPFSPFLFVEAFEGVWFFASKFWIGEGGLRKLLSGLVLCSEICDSSCTIFLWSILISSSLSTWARCIVGYSDLFRLEDWSSRLGWDIIIGRA